MSRSPKEHREDSGYKQAKRQGYRARSAFKLFEIQKRFNIFKRSFYILDIGSAPGSWLQVSKKFAEDNLDKYNDSHYHRDHFKILGIDIKKISPLENVKILRMDVNNPQIGNKIEEFFGGKVIDLIISDASINKSGNQFSDQVNQFRLCYKILEFTQFLKSKGNFVIKVFQGADFDKFYHTMRTKFLSVKSYKPQASNKKSNEIYLVGLKKK